MSQIQTVTAPTLTPPPTMNPSIAGKPGAVMAGADDQFASAADMGFAVDEKLKQAQDQGILLDAENKIAADIQKANAGLSTWTDYTKAGDLKQQTADTLREKYQEQYGNRPDLWRHIEPYLGQELNSYNRAVDHRTGQLTQDFNQTALMVSQLRAESDAATEPTIDGKEKIWATQDAKTDAMVANGSLWPSQGEEAKRQLRSRTIATEVDRAANPLNSPEVMEAEMSRLKEYEGKGYVDPKELEQMQDHLGVAYERALNRSDRVDVSKQGDAVLNSLKNDPTLKDPETREFDHMAAAKKVDDDPNVPTKVKKYVREELEQEAGATQKLQNDKDQKILDSLDPKVESGSLTYAELTRRENLAPGQPDWLPRRVADHLLTRAAQIQRENRVQNTQERMEMRQEQAIDSANIARELAASPGYLSSESELFQGDNAKLSRADRATIWAMKNVKGVKEYQDAEIMMRASGAYPNTDEGNAKLFSDLSALRQAVDSKKLVGKQIIDEATGMLNPKLEEQKNSQVRTLLDNIWSNGMSILGGISHTSPGILPGGVRVTPIVPNTAPEPSTPKTRKEYFDGMKKANPQATDAQINAYLDKKGVE